MATEGDGVTGEDGQGQGGDGNPPTTRASEESGADGGNDGMARRLRTVLPPRPRDTSVDNDSAGLLLQQFDSTDGARPKNGIHPRRKYVLLAPEEPEEPEEPEGGQYNTGSWVRGYGHGGTQGTAEEGLTETPTGDKTGQCALLVRGM